MLLFSLSFTRCVWYISEGTKTNVFKRPALFPIIWIDCWCPMVTLRVKNNAFGGGGPRSSIHQFVT